MKRVIRSAKWAMALLALGAFSSSTVSAATTSCGTLNPADSCSSGLQVRGAGEVDEYQFTAGSGVTGVELSGDRSTGEESFYVLSTGQAEIFDSSASTLGGSFNVVAGSDYTLYIMGTGAQAYDFALTAVPLPAAAWLFGSVLVALGVTARKRNMSSPA